jgi:MoaA/NifB/PqqE/SkfB family radical SAM enzyme
LGGAAQDHRAPLFFAWQLTNRCDAGCLHCCEESGPDRAWSDEMNPEQVRAVLAQIEGAGVPYVALGGGEPMGHPQFWEIIRRLSQRGIELKIETNGQFIDRTGVGAGEPGRSDA